MHCFGGRKGEQFSSNSYKGPYCEVHAGFPLLFSISVVKEIKKVNLLEYKYNVLKKKMIFGVSVIMLTLLPFFFLKSSVVERTTD